MQVPFNKFGDLDHSIRQMPTHGVFANLIGQNIVGTSQVQYTADFAILHDTMGRALALTDVDLTGDLTTDLDTGDLVQDWYSVWFVAKRDGTSKMIFSLESSLSAVTMPTGYTYGARVGWVYKIYAYDYVRGFLQHGNEVSLRLDATYSPNYPTPASGVQGTAGSATNALVAVDLSTTVPVTAFGIVLGAHISSTEGSSVAVAPGSQHTGGVDSGILTATWQIIQPSSYQPSMLHEVYVPIQTTQVIYYAGNYSTNYISCMGWKDNL